MAATKKTAKGKSYEGFTAEEVDAMKEHAKEMKRAAAKADGETAVLEKIAELPDADRVIAEGIHALVKEHAPELEPKTYYGMPAYAKDGKTLCFFQPAAKFKTRYGTFGFENVANLDDGAMWPTAFAVTKLTTETKARIAELLKQAVS